METSSEANSSRRRAIFAGACATISITHARGLLAQQRRRQIAVTIDDGPATGAGEDLSTFRRISVGIRQAFVAEKVPAIMFINERQLHERGQRDARVQILEDWLQAGLDIGNHTYSHRRLEESELTEFYDDIIKGEVISRPLLRRYDRRLTWFRYPYLSTDRGDRAAAVETFLHERDYQIAPVTVDYKDYSFASNYSRYLRAGDQAGADELFASVMRALDQAFDHSEKRSQEVLGYELPQVLLMHCNEMNSLNLRETLQRIRRRGYEFVSIEHAMQDTAYRTSGLPSGALGGNFLGSLGRRSSQ